MIQQLYSIRDIKTGEHTPPFSANYDEEAIREFSNLLLSDNHSKFARYPREFDLYRVGTFDTKNPALLKSDGVFAVIQGVDVKEQKL